MTPCVFFDRDGIVNLAPTKRYVEHRDEFHIMEGFFATLAHVIHLGYVAIIVTNQKGVSSGATPIAELEAMHHMIREQARQRGLHILDILYCDAPDEEHPRRKPNPGMLIEAAQKHGIDLTSSWMVGDNEKDVIAGQRAGCRTIFVGTKQIKSQPDFQVDDMNALAAAVSKMLPPVSGGG